MGVRLPIPLDNECAPEMDRYVFYSYRYRNLLIFFPVPLPLPFTVNCPLPLKKCLLPFHLEDLFEICIEIKFYQTLFRPSAFGTRWLMERVFTPVKLEAKAL